MTNTLDPDEVYELTRDLTPAQRRTIARRMLSDDMLSTVMGPLEWVMEIILLASLIILAQLAMYAFPFATLGPTP